VGKDLIPNHYYGGDHSGEYNKENESPINEIIMCGGGGLQQKLLERGRESLERRIYKDFGRVRSSKSTFERTEVHIRRGRPEKGTRG